MKNKLRKAENNKFFSQFFLTLHDYEMRET